MLNYFCFILMASVRKVQTENIYACFDQGQQFIIRVAGGTNGGNNLSPVKSMFQTSLLIHLAVDILIEIF
jgi:hypothetical protein